MKRILVLTTALSTGGITSFTIPLIKELSKMHEVTLAYTVDACDKLKQIPLNVRKVSYCTGSSKSTILYMLTHGWLYHAFKIKTRKHNRISPIASIQRIAFASAEVTKLPKELLEEYDVAISTAEFYCNDLIVSKIRAKKKIGWIHPDYKALHADVAFDRRTLDVLDVIVTVSESTRRSLLEVIPSYPKKVIYLPNLVDAKRLWQLSEKVPVEYRPYSNQRIIVTVCRLDNSSKRLDRVVSIVQKMPESKGPFHWFIVGDGPDFEALKKMIDRGGVNNRITLLGMRKNPYPYIRYADLFVLTSQYEGKPLVVDEAITLQCPVIATKYASAEEQIQKSYGYLIENDDKQIVEEFLSVIDWKDIGQKKRNLSDNNYNIRNQEEFDAGIEKLLGDVI